MDQYAKEYKCNPFGVVRTSDGYAWEQVEIPFVSPFYNTGNKITYGISTYADQGKMNSVAHSIGYSFEDRIYMSLNTKIKYKNSYRPTTEEFEKSLKKEGSHGDHYLVHNGDIFTNEQYIYPYYYKLFNKKEGLKIFFEYWWEGSIEGKGQICFKGG